MLLYSALHYVPQQLSSVSSHCNYLIVLSSCQSIIGGRSYSMAMKCMIQCIRPKQNNIENSHLFTKNCVIDLLSFGADLDGDFWSDNVWYSFGCESRLGLQSMIFWTTNLLLFSRTRQSSVYMVHTKSRFDFGFIGEGIDG